MKMTRPTSASIGGLGHRSPAVGHGNAHPIQNGLWALWMSCPVHNSRFTTIRMARAICCATIRGVAVATHAYRYLRPSSVEPGGRLGLETSGGLTAVGPATNPRFFVGFLASPQVAAAGLLAVATVAGARYYQPRLAALRDPVVTCNGDRLRFESFSGCCGVYARLDVLSDALDGEVTERGTTNVDVNGPLRAALARVGTSPLHLAVGPDELAITTLDDSVIEKQVPLPERWLRGFAEVQVISASFDLRAELPQAEAIRFLRSLPAGYRPGALGSGALWAVPAGRGLRQSARPVPGAVCLAGPERLEALRPLLRFARALRVYGPPVRPGSPPCASAWELALPGMRLVLTLSPEAKRGFSGEGAVLDALASDDVAADADLVGALLSFEPRVEVDLLAERSELSPTEVKAALGQLGTAGRVGYDVAEAAYFHRELPYDASRVERMNPRLRNARALLAAGAVTLDGQLATVVVEDRVHRVRLAADGAALGCTCPWWAKYSGSRGKCKHVLAAELAHRGEPAAQPDDSEDSSENSEVPA
jgi:SWIM zinc finger